MIYDRFRPETPPEANALYFGALPPGPAYEKSKDVEQPDDPRLGRLAPADAVHPRPLGRRIAKATVVEPPPGSTVLIESDSGPLAFVAPRERVLRRRRRLRALVEDRSFNTDWVTQVQLPAVPLQRPAGRWATPASRPATRSTCPASRSSSGPRPAGDAITVTGPDGQESQTLKRTPQGTFVFNDANATGLYHARWGPTGRRRSPSTSSTPARATSPPAGSSPRGPRPTRPTPTRSRSATTPSPAPARPSRPRHDWWKPLAVAGPGRRAARVVHLQPAGLHLTARIPRLRRASSAGGEDRGHRAGDGLPIGTMMNSPTSTTPTSPRCLPTSTRWSARELAGGEKLAWVGPAPAPAGWSPGLDPDRRSSGSSSAGSRLLDGHGGGDRGASRYGRAGSGCSAVSPCSACRSWSSGSGCWPRRSGPARAASRTCYAVTDRRAIVWEPGLWDGAPGPELRPRAARQDEPEPAGRRLGRPDLRGDRDLRAQGPAERHPHGLLRDRPRPRGRGPDPLDPRAID